MNSITRVTANILFSIIISFVFADIAFYGFGFIKSSPLNAAIVVFASCFVASLLICELFSISKESNKIKNKVKKSRLSKIAKRIAIENARYSRRIRGSGQALINQETSDTGTLNQTPSVNDFKKEQIKSENRLDTDSVSSGSQSAEQKKLKESSPKQQSGSEKSSSAPNLAVDEKIVSLYVGNLSYTVQNTELEQLLIKYGKAEKISIMRNNKGKKKKAYAYIRMKKSEAEKAASELNSTVFQSKSIIVKVSYSN
jgi:RNA recognition motif-containing protein